MTKTLTKDKPDYIIFLSMFILFLLTLLLTSCKYRNYKCADIKKGKFLYHSSITGKNYFIERSDTVQREEDLISKKVGKNKISWINDCEYLLASIPDTFKTRDKIDSFFESTPIKISIIKVTSSYYIFSARVDSVGKELIVTDTMKIIN